MYAREPDPPRTVLIEIKVDWTWARIQKEIRKQAERYAVSAEVMESVIKCESMGSTTIQSRIVENGVREESYGLAQINLPHNPNVTKEEAQDPEYAINFMARAFSQGLHHRWTCWRDLYQ